MTLIISLLSKDFSVQLSDRRLTSASGIVTDESNKAVVWVTPQGRLVMGYSGLAMVEGKSVLDRAMEILAGAGEPDYDIQSMIRRFADRIGESFQAPNFTAVDPKFRATSFHFIGHLRTEVPLPVAFYVSNWHDPANHQECWPPGAHFRVSGGLLAEPSGNPYMVLPLGTHRHIGHEAYEPLADMLEQGRPPEALVGKGVDDARVGTTKGSPQLDRTSDQLCHTPGRPV